MYVAKCVMCGSPTKNFRGVEYTKKNRTDYFRMPICEACDEELYEQHLGEAKENGVIQYID